MYPRKTNNCDLCDFCGGAYPGVCIESSGKNVDICKTCVQKSIELLNINITNPTTTLMGKLSAVAKRIFDKDTKTLIKAEYLNSDLSLTSKGMENIHALLLQAHKKELVELAEEDIEEAKES